MPDLPGKIRLNFSGHLARRIIESLKHCTHGHLERTMGETKTNEETEPTVASPVATGGGGTQFEQSVNAYWLSLLLVRGLAPVIHPSAVVEVTFQTERLGWNTDDFLVIGESGQSQRRKLVGQVKNSFTVSSKDGECKKAFTDFWKDFKNPGRFDAALDAFVLVTQRGTNQLLEHFARLLDSARASRNAAEFESRLSTKGLLNKTAKGFASQIKAIISEHEGRAVTDADIWPFLRVIHVLSLDLATSTRQQEANVKTLLAFTATVPDPLAAAESSWDSLLKIASEGMPEAKTFSYADLPEPLRLKHSPATGPSNAILATLKGHTEVLLATIVSQIGRKVHLPRVEHIQQVLNSLESSQVVLLSGQAGIGKSGVAKDVLQTLSANHFTAAFRAEEFALPHFDTTLKNAGLPSNAADLGAVMGGHGRKVLLIESIERLLEAPTKDAFYDLIGLISKDQSWQLVVTCRDYSADLVRAALFHSRGVTSTAVPIAQLNDDELDEMVATFPQLKRPLADPTLRALLRNPYVLDKALGISWEDHLPLPKSEREFRSLFWKDIIRADDKSARGMPQRRDDIFTEVALKRAQMLTMHVLPSSNDPEAIQTLRAEGLITSSEKNERLLAPAHDVLEDWAILRWLDGQFEIHIESISDFANALGTFPAIRRTYRKWVGELISVDPTQGDLLFQAAIRTSSLPLHFRDDTLVSLLRSAAAPAFLDRQKADLFRDDNALIKRLVHLLRVACIATPTWMPKSLVKGSLFGTPDGVAWPCILGLIAEHLDSFARADYSLLLQLTEDWARGVNVLAPYPPGSEAVAAIASWLLDRLDEYGSGDVRKRVLQVIAKIPKAASQTFADVLAGLDSKEGWRGGSRTLHELVFEEIDGWAAARDLPDVIITAAKKYLLCQEKDLEDKWGYRGSRLGKEIDYGIKEGLGNGFFPASGIRGPYVSLLRHHPDKGISLVVEIFNHSSDWYVNPRLRCEYQARFFEVKLIFADGTEKIQAANPDLWGLYRGMSNGPYVLQSLLMAFERWLLEYAEVFPEQLDGVLIDVLKRSDSAMLSGVVAAVATAFPHQSPETLLVLLKCPRLIRMDHARKYGEHNSPSNFMRSLPRLTRGRAHFDAEREAADSQPHRQHDLETAILNLQAGPAASRVQEVLDQLRAELPAINDRTEEDRVNALSLLRMDLRKYRASLAEDASDDQDAVVTEQTASGAKEETAVQTEPVIEEPGEGGEDGSAGGMTRIRLDLEIDEPDLQAMTRAADQNMSQMGSALGLSNWGVRVFKKEEGPQHNPAEWRKMLAAARVFVPSDDLDSVLSIGRGGPGYVAAVCVRDHWDEMSEDEAGWCIETICSEVTRTADVWNDFARVQRGVMEADRPCAWVVPLLFGKPLKPNQSEAVREALAVGLTHSNKEVRVYAAWGVGVNLWAVDEALARRCANAIATDAWNVEVEFDADSEKPHPERQSNDEIEKRSAFLIRKSFWNAEIETSDALNKLDTSRWFGADANSRILAIVGQSPKDAMAIAAFERLSRTMVGWWEKDEKERRGAGRHPQRSIDVEASQGEILQSFLLRTSDEGALKVCTPLLAAVEEYPDKVRWVMEGLIVAEDHNPNTPRFWMLWKLFAERVARASWIQDIEERHPTGREMLAATFLRISWKDETRHWPSLVGYSHLVDDLFMLLPPSSLVMDDYVSFLFHIGEQSMPAAFPRLAKKLQQGVPATILRKSNTVFVLEMLLQRFVFGKPFELKQNRELRESVLYLLDMLVEVGSSAAFQMRDDFVTPLPAA